MVTRSRRHGGRHVSGDDGPGRLHGGSSSRRSIRCSGWAATQRSGSRASRPVVSPGAMAAIRRSTRVVNEFFGKPDARCGGGRHRSR